MRRLLGLLLITSSVFGPAIFAKGAEPPAFTYSPKPPGAIVESRLAYLAGEGMQSQWRAVISKNAVGTGDDGRRFYQYYLSIYQIDGSTYRLKFQSPRDGGPFTLIEQAHGAKLWFPVQSARIVGIGEFRAPAVQQLVVQSHEMAADCGMATVTVFTYDQKRMKVAPSIVVKNPCDLQASVVNPANQAVLRLQGPYYAPDAAMCCPTKNNAVSTLRYTGGKWVEKPQYFALHG